MVQGLQKSPPIAFKDTPQCLTQAVALQSLNMAELWVIEQLSADPSFIQTSVTDCLSKQKFIEQGLNASNAYVNWWNL